MHNYENEIIYSNNHNEYTIKKFLGSGSAGQVYSGMNNKTGEENVAIKIINKKNANVGQVTIDEIQIMLDFACLDNVVKLIDHGVIDDDIYIMKRGIFSQLTESLYFEQLGGEWIII